MEGCEWGQWWRKWRKRRLKVGASSGSSPGKILKSVPDYATSENRDCLSDCNRFFFRSCWFFKTQLPVTFQTGRLLFNAFSFPFSLINMTDYRFYVPLCPSICFHFQDFVSFKFYYYLFSSLPTPNFNAWIEDLQWNYILGPLSAWRKITETINQWGGRQHWRLCWILNNHRKAIKKIQLKIFCFFFFF